MRLSIIGCGKLGNLVADAILNGIIPEYQLIGVYSRTSAKAVEMANKMSVSDTECKVCESIEEIIELHPDIIVEAASPALMKELAIPALQKGCSIITLSIGAFADDSFYNETIETAKQHGSRVYIVNGATGGFDILQTVSLMGNAEANFFNEKNPKALKGTAVYREELENEQKVVFKGTASEAIAMFPTKVNVTVAASRASVGPQNMKVTMLSSPGFVGDTQRVEIKNHQVHAVIDVYSATAEIAGWSVVNTLKNLSSPIVFC